MQTSPRGECLHSSWRAFNACSEGNRHQPAPLLAYTWELGVFLTARAPNRRRWSPAFGGRDDPGRARQTHGRENGHDHIARHRPRGAAARRRWILLQTQGLSRKGGVRSPGSFAPLRRTHRSGGLVPACGRRVEIAHVIARRLCLCNTARPLDTWQHTCFDSAATQANAGALPLCRARHNPRTVGRYG